MLRLLVSIKNSDSIKNYLEINLRREKEHLVKYSSTQIFLESQCLTYDLVDILGLSVFINGSLP